MSAFGGLVDTFPGNSCSPRISGISQVLKNPWGNGRGNDLKGPERPVGFPLFGGIGPCRDGAFLNESHWRLGGLHEAKDLAPETAFQHQQWRRTKVHHGNLIDAARPTISYSAAHRENYA